MAIGIVVGHVVHATYCLIGVGAIIANGLSKDKHQWN